MRKIGSFVLFFVVINWTAWAGSIHGQGVTMDPAETFFNASVTLRVTFRVEGEPVALFTHEFAVRKAGQVLPPPPTIAGAAPTMYPVGTHQVNISWTTPPKSECMYPGYDFDIVCGGDRQVLIRGVRLAVKRQLVGLVNSGLGMRVYPAPAAAGGTVERREPALEILRPLFRDGGRIVEFYAHRPGTGFALNVRWEIEAFLDGRWQHIASGVIARLNAGSDVRVSQAGFPSTTAEKARIKLVSPPPEVSVEVIKPLPDLNPSNCHVRRFPLGGNLDFGFGISNLGKGDAGSFLVEFRKFRDGRWLAFYSMRVSGIGDGGRFVQGNITFAAGDITKGETLKIEVDTENVIREGNEGNNTCDVTWGADH